METKIEAVYGRLLESFGPQHWWPVTKEPDLEPKYHKSIKLNEKQKLEICFGAILTQNTSWKNVEKAIIQLNKNNLINIDKVIKIKNNELAKIIKSSGYHNQKAKKLKNFCNFLKTNYNSEINLLLNKDITGLRNELLSVNGIGPETADSIILYAAKKPIFAIDAYTKRIYSRAFGIKKELKYDELQRIFMENLPNDEKLFNECHALLVELGKSICKTKPLCDKCPINKSCSYYMKECKNHRKQTFK
ncbi:endonuclease III domain-containing protein [Candidatus Woesearchaeota archaeon]|nr:endonuclease III domain-containing protein [Candidatus Woesearchaeota archaeon]